jgi:peptide/nickel transport system permease protein
MKNTKKKTALDRKMDKIKAREEMHQTKANYTSRTWRKFISNRLTVVGLVLFVVICILCFAAPLFTNQNPNDFILTNKLQPPSVEHIFGTDQMGRDVWTRMLYGGRISIIVGVVSGLGSTGIGVILGLLASYKGGLIDAILLKVTEVLNSVPSMMLIIIFVALFGHNMSNMILIFVFTGWGGTYRMIRSKVLSLKEQEFVQALQAFGISSSKICFKHLLPNTMGPIMVNLTLSIAGYIMQEASLSVLGYGIDPGVATWGNIINVLTNAGTIRFDWLGYWWMWAPCAVMLVSLVLSVNFIGDGLRDASDPSQVG